MPKPEKIPTWDPLTPPLVVEYFRLEVVSGTVILTCKECRQEWAASVPFNLVVEHASRHRFPPALPVSPSKKKGQFPG
jgi:hypothetical protein